MKRLPLEGIRVADLTMMWAGPYATRILGEMGAEIIKIESPSAWDNVRTLFPRPDDPEPWNSSFYFNDYNRDKKSVTIDLSQDLGRELFLDLAPHCDVVIENYRADVLDNLGLGYEVLRQRRENIILVSMAGFGKTGSEYHYVGFGPIIEQMGGLASMTGYGGDGVPVKTGISYGDPVAGAAAAGAVALALIHRQRTGEGAFIDLAQRETMAAMIGEAFAAASLRGETPVHRGNRHPTFAPQGVYRCEGEDEWVAISVRTDAEWHQLASRIGLAQQSEIGVRARREQHDEIDAKIEVWTRTRSAQEAMEILQKLGIPAGRVLDSDAIHSDLQLEARGFWVELPHPRRPVAKQPSSAWRLVEANPQLRQPAPLFGQHNREILGGLVGRSEADLQKLTDASVIGDAPINPGIG